MLLAIDVGNSNTVLGLYDGEKLIYDWRIRTVANHTVDEYGMLIVNLYKNVKSKSQPVTLTGIIISCVVPPMLNILEPLCKKYFGLKPLIVEPGIKTGMPIFYDNPKEVGADRIVNTLAAHHLFGGPAIVVDFGTSTNLDVVSAKGEFLGGALAPGIEISLDALAARAAQLRKVELVRPRSVIGKNTVEALQSGALYGFAGQVDGLVDRIVAELGGRVTAVVATGGLAPIVVAESRTITDHEPDLTLIGLDLIYSKNVTT